MSSIEEFEARVKQLEYRFGLLRSLANGHQSSVTSAILNSDLTQDEVSAVYDLLRRTQKAVSEGRAPTRAAFEEALNAIKPLSIEDGDPDERLSWFHAGVVAKAALNRRQFNVAHEYLESIHVTF